MEGDLSLLSLSKDENAKIQQKEHFSAIRFEVMEEYHHKFRKKFKNEGSLESPLLTGKITTTSPKGSPAILPNGSPASSDLVGIPGGSNFFVIPDYQIAFKPWRQRQRMRTTSVLLVCCLNIGYTQDEEGGESGGKGRRPVLQAWIDPSSIQDAGRAIGEALQHQYQRWQPRAISQHLIDPTVSEVKRTVTVLRRGANQDRLLFHYNGHGVPKPTANGEIWVFNRHYTQYIPLSVFDLFMWASAPTIYVLDCPSAGLIIDSYHRFPKTERKSSSYRPRRSVAQNGKPDEDEMESPPEVIILAACGAQETLPSDPGLPADIFTSCLTTPLKVALRWAIKHQRLTSVTEDMLQHLPGKLSDRRTPLGELNWIFTAVTDAIAWTTLPPTLFHHLFRQDVLVSSLFRNFLLASRIFATYGCTPMSLPALPSLSTLGDEKAEKKASKSGSSTTHRNEHQMWEFWDVAVEFCLAQLERYVHDKKEIKNFEANPFFTQQLEAFRVWLRFGSVENAPPPQLPVVLQNLLSQAHRVPALLLLAKFVDRGPWAVNLALGVGVFPYFLKLLQSPDQKVRRLLIFIWTKILAIDHTCQSDLLRDRHHLYFAAHLDTDESHVQKCFALFILSKLCDKNRNGQQKIIFPHGPSQSPRSMPTPLGTPGSTRSTPTNRTTGHSQKDMGLFRIISDTFKALSKENKTKLESDNGGGSLPLLRRWLALGVGKAWEAYEVGKTAGIEARIHIWLWGLLADPVSEVRTAAVYALGLLISPLGARGGWEDQEKLELAIGERLARLHNDASPIVRREVIIALGNLCYHHRKRFVKIASLAKTGSKKRTSQPRAIGKKSLTSSRISPKLHPRRGTTSSPDEIKTRNQRKSIDDRKLGKPHFGRSHTFCFNNSEGNAGTEGHSSLPAQQHNSRISISSSEGTPACSPLDKKNQIPEHVAATASSVAAEAAILAEAKLAKAQGVALVEQRMAWRIGDSLEVYSVSRGRWFHGTVKALCAGARIEVLYKDNRGRGGKKVVYRFSSTDVRPFTGTLEKPKSRSGSMDAKSKVGSSEKKIKQVSISLSNTTIDAKSTTFTPSPNVKVHVMGSPVLAENSSYSSFPRASSYEKKSEGEPGTQQRVYVWSHISSLCEDPHPVVAETARNLVKYIFRLATPDSAIRRIHSVPARLGNKRSVASSGLSSGRGARLSTVLSQDNLKDAAAREQKRKTTVRPDNKALFEDERKNDTFWDVPTSDVFLRGCSHFTQRLMQNADDDDDDSAIDKQWRARRNLARLKRAEREWQKALGTNNSPSWLNSGVMKEGKRGAPPRPPRKPDVKKRPSTIIGISKATSSTTKPESSSSTWWPRWGSPASPALSADSEKLADVQSGSADINFEQQATYKAGHQEVSCVAFHPYESLLVTAHPRDHITVWDHAQSRQKKGVSRLLNHFANGNGSSYGNKPSKITGLAFANDLHISLLIAGSDDGGVRVWKQPHTKKAEALVTAWSAAPKMRRTATRVEGPGLIMDWNQKMGLLATSGNSSRIKLWNVNSEQQERELKLGNEFVTSMHSDLSGNTLVVGCADGSVRQLDLRQEQASILLLQKNSRSPVVKTHMQRNDPPLVITALSSGLISLCDPRIVREKYPGIMTFKAHAQERAPLDVCTVHDYAPLVATGSRQQFGTIYDLRDGRKIRRLKYHEGFLGQRLGPVSAMSFHQYELLLAVGCKDIFISTYKGRLV
mmetsp:Transcript_13889/g.20979  ORF Transcript_13889/g.20979 Transcript_13889/m.20979 type:complete len:1711 (+) Transcript_13889:99-5231(+)